MKRLLVLTPFTLLALAVPASAGGGCATGEPATLAAATTIKIEHACYFPVAARVATGATVTWLNDSGLDHNLSGPGIEFADMPNGASYRQTFTRAGLYPFSCSIHAGMSGVVVVGDVGLPAAAAVNPPGESAAAVPVSKATPDDGGTSFVPWVVGGVLILVASGAVVTFAKREGRVPVPAR